MRAGIRFRDPVTASAASRRPMRCKAWSGRWDLNPGPSGPQPDALPGCATPRAVQDSTADADYGPESPVLDEDLPIN